MIMGGGPAGKPNKTDAIDNVDIVDLKQPNPNFVPASPLNFPRLHLNSVLLPDRTVFVTGGSLKRENQPLDHFKCACAMHVRTSCSDHFAASRQYTVGQLAQELRHHAFF